MDIAVVGMAGRFPGANSVDNFWQNLLNKHSAITNTLENRWGKLSDIPESLKDVKFAFIDNIHEFDRKLFDLKMRDAQRISPQQRMILESSYQAFEDAGFSMDSLQRRPVGVFIGTGTDEYPDLLEQADIELDAFYEMGSDLPMLSGRISRFFNLKGPSQIVNASCASSGVALFDACQSLINGSCESALVGGIYLLQTPKKLMMHVKLGTLSPNGNCAPFDDSANGMVLGEASCAVVLKPLSKAIEDGDKIYSVIKACGVNHDGNAEALACPNGKAQTELLESLYQDYDIEPDSINYLETHGTGTKIGDPTEFNSMSAVFDKNLPGEKVKGTQRKILLGTTKANVGHCTASAALLGLIKASLIVYHKIAPPNCNFSKENSQIDFSSSCFTTLNEPQPLPDTQLRVAVNAFGYVGTNFHSVVESPPKRTSDHRQGPEVITLTAQSAENLLATAKLLKTWLAEQEAVELNNLAFTLARRKRYSKVAVLSVCDQDTLQSQLTELIAALQGIDEDKIQQQLHRFHDAQIAQLQGQVDRQNQLMLAVSGFGRQELAYPPGALMLDIPSLPLNRETCTPKEVLALRTSNTKVKNETQLSNNPGSGQQFQPQATVNHSAEVIKSQLLTMVAEFLEEPESKLGIDKPLMQLGIDSILALQFVESLNVKFTTQMDIVDLYEHPSIEALAAYLYQNQSDAITPETTPDSQVTQAVDSAMAQQAGVDGSGAKVEEDIAIIGVSCRFPGAKDKDQFWQNLKDGVCSISGVPENRWDAEQFYDSDHSQPWKTNSKWGGFIEDAENFDPMFFGISPKEAMLMDPQQRLILQECWRVLEDAAIDADSLSGKSVGVYTASAHGDYVRRLDRLDISPTSHLFTGNNLAILAARISYHLNLKGPAQNIDTACSSSLVALNMALENLRKGHCEMAMVAGVTIFSTEYNYLYYAKSGMLAPDGRCKVFDNNADGFVPGEGAAAILLKPLSKAIADGDNIYSVIRASGSNQDGKTNGITAPSMSSQTNLTKVLLQQAGVDASQLGMVEAHGTGTKLGDPIEIGALTTAFRQHTQQNQFCYIGSVKSNIGHTIMCAGLAGLIKATLSVKNQFIPATINLKQHNEHIKFAQSPFKTTTTGVEWAGPGKRLALVNSFGMSGTNAQVLLESYDTPLRTCESERLVFPLSAKTEVALLQRVNDLIHLIEAQPSLMASNLAYTLQNGRMRMKCKVAFIATDIRDLARLLNHFAKGEFDDRNIFVAAPALISCVEAQCIADWFGEKAQPWQAITPQTSLSKLCLPTYPFSGQAYWYAHNTMSRGQTSDTKPSSGEAVMPDGAAHSAADMEEIYQHLAAILDDILGLDLKAIEHDESLFNMGLDSITGLSFKEALEKAFSMTIPLKDIFDNLTINTMAKYLLSLNAMDNQSTDQQSEDSWTQGDSNLVTPLELKRDCLLRPDIARLLTNKDSKTQNQAAKRIPKRILLTGASGFVGAYLLNELLTSTECQIVCLSRDNNEQEARQRILDNLASYSLNCDVDDSRLAIHYGDLNQSNLGLEESKFVALGNTLDSILHVGAVVNHVLSYRDIKQTNVDGTQEIIKLACCGDTLLPLHYISTIGTAIRRLLPTSETVVYEKEILQANAVGLEVGYGQSKWVGEQILAQAQEMGLPVSIYRIGEITGHSQKQQCRTDDMFHMFVNLFYKTKMAPQEWSAGIIDIVPINYVSKAVTHMVVSPDVAPDIYHIVHPNPVSVMSLFAWFDKQGDSFQKVSFDDWRVGCEKFAAEGQDAVDKVVAQFMKMTPFDYRFTWYFKDYHLKMHNTEKALAGAEISCPELDEDLFKNCFSYLFPNN